MSLSLILACLWALVACLAAMLPSRDQHWRLAYVLIAAGLPILAFVGWRHGALAALVVLVAACSILRWPVIHLARWLRRRLGPRGG